MATSDKVMEELRAIKDQEFSEHIEEGIKKLEGSRLAENIRPVPADRVLIRADPRQKVTAGGIELPEFLTGIERVSVETGRIVRAGSRVKEVLGEDLKPGTRVAYRGFVKDVSKTEINSFIDDNGTDVFILKAEDILAVVDDDSRVGVFA